MESKTIKISGESYRKLLNIASRLQVERNRLVSFDEAIKNMEEKKVKKESNIMDSAGAWNDMSDEEANEFLETTYKERKIKSRRLH